MPSLKDQTYSDRQSELAALAKALGHPARVAILEHLLTVDSCIGGELVENLPLAQPTVSRHLRELKEIGLIKGHVEGTRINYCINAERWEEVKKILSSFFSHPVSPQSC